MPETELTELIARSDVDEVVLAYSDLSHQAVMHKASTVLAAGADFKLLGPDATMLRSTKPVVAVCAVRTGSGKSQTSRRVGKILLDAGLKVALVRHPMPYGDLERMRVQRFASLADIDASDPTVEEREEYELPVELGMVMYAGVDYRDILEQAQEEADVIVWDGGNNDFPFFRPDLLITVVDPLRAGHELKFHPGETNLRMADVVVVNKLDSADAASIERVLTDVAAVNPRAAIVRANSPVTLDEGPSLAGAAVLVIEDGPTVTHGGMPFGAGTVAAQRAGVGHAGRPAAVRLRLDRGRLPRQPAPRQRPPGDGLLRRAAPRARGDDQPVRLRRGHHRHADRPGPADRLGAPDPARRLRARGDRLARPRGGAAAARPAHPGDDARTHELKGGPMAPTTLTGQDTARHLLRVSDLDTAQVEWLLDLAAGDEGVAERLARDASGTDARMLLREAVDPDARLVRGGGAAARDAAAAAPPRRAAARPGEPIADTARVLSSYAAGIVIRTFAQETIEQVAAAATVPVVNALSDEHHPCQALADLLTLRERFGRLEGLRVAYVGDGNNVATSLIEAGRLTGVEVVVGAPPGFGPTLPDAHVVEDPRDAVSGADAVYTDVWVSMGDEAERERRLHDLEPYRVDAELMALARPGAVFLHCLPAHRGEEVADEVIDGPQSVVWQQAANRLPTEQALLYGLIARAPGFAAR